MKTHRYIARPIRYAAIVTLTVIVSSSAWSAGPAFQETFDSGNAAVWSGMVPEYVDHNGGLALKISSVNAYASEASSEPSSRKVFAKLDPDLIRDKRIKLTAKVKANDISSPLKPHYGIKVMLEYVTDVDKQYRQIVFDEGTFDWSTFHVVIDVPSDVESARLHLGLEGVTGEVAFDDIEIEVEKY